MTLEFQQAFRPSLYESPFDVDDPGFKRSWWAIPPGSYRDAYHDWYRLVRGREEVVRVEVNACRLISSEDYHNWPRDQYVAEITFIEVRAGLVRQDLGSEVIRNLVRRYGDRTLAAHPKDSDGFWERLGWLRYDNIRNGAHEPPLYALPLA